MSARAERVFLSTLRELERELPIPMPERVRILRELEHDLEGLRSRLEAQGLTAEEARTRALEVLAPDGATLRELGRLHLPLYLRLTHGLRGDHVRIAERAALAVAAGTVVALEARLLLGTQLLRTPSSFIWPVLALGALLFAAVAGKAFEVWVRRDHRAPERGLGAILVLSAATVVTGLVGAFVELYGLVAAFEHDPVAIGALALDWLVRASGLVAIALLLAMTGALAWFLLAHWIALVTGARRDLRGIARPTSRRSTRSTRGDP